MKRVSLVGLLVLLAISPFSTAGAEQRPPASLVWVERQSSEDLTALLTAGLPVVMESTEGLFLNDGYPHLPWLEEHGYIYSVLDPDTLSNEYLLVGLRPDSDREAVLSFGLPLLEKDNWVLLSIPERRPLQDLLAHRVFVSRLPGEPMRLPTPRTLAANTRQGRAWDPLVQTIVDAIDTVSIDQMWLDLTANPPSGTRYSTADGCFDAADYCYDKYVEYRIPVEFQNWSGTHAPNVIGTIEGAIHPEDVYIMIGHLDDLPQFGPAPGADDNASGSVNVLAAAEVMSCYGYRSTVKFITVTGEELGLLGSQAYASDAEQRNENILGVINMDMIGWEGNASPDPENLDLNYNSTSESLALQFADNATEYGTGLAVDAFSCPSLTASDHWPFWQRGWSAVVGITDNEGYCGHGGNYPYYHTSNDTIANNGDPAFFYGVVKAATATIAELAEPFILTMGSPVAACGAPIDLVVADADLNSDPGSVQTVQVSVWSDTESTPELIALSERNADSLLFSGQIGTTFNAPGYGDGILSLSQGDTINAQYLDALTCDGTPNVTHIATAGLDCGPPVISNVHESGVSDIAAAIEWITNEEASSALLWGETIPPQNSESVAGLTLQHAVPLTALEECTVYYYSVESSDGPGNITTDDNNGQYHHFETLGDFGEGLQQCRTGAVEIDLPFYGCGETVTFVLTDLDLNPDPNSVDSTTLPVSSSSETTTETVTFTETGPNSSRYTASISLAAGSPQSDGLLQAKDGDVVTVTYIDADDGSGSSFITVDTAVVDCAGPVISNLRLRDVTDQRLTLLFDTDQPGDTVIEWGATPALGESITQSALTTSHSATINEMDICQSLYFHVSSSDELGNTTVEDLDGSPYQAHTWDIPGLYWRETFETGAPGWSLQGEWEVGAPQGLGGSDGYPDPVGAYSNQQALGNDLSGLGGSPGDYEHAVSELADSPELNAREWANTKLLLNRQLNVRHHDNASIAVLDRNSETVAFSNNSTIISQNGYSPMSLDISNEADGARNLVLRFSLVSDGQNLISDDGIASGWNIDDVILKDGSLPDYAACGGCAVPPSFKGVRSAQDLDPCGGGGVIVRWNEAVSWGTGAIGTYAVYRDTAPGFTPSAANRLAMGIAGTSYIDTEAPQDQTLHYCVIAENDESCGAGPSNDGLTSPNPSYAMVSESSTLPAPEEIQALKLQLVNLAHVGLAWEESPTSSAYMLYRSQGPLPGGFTLREQLPGTAFEDLDQWADPGSYFYLVTGINDCGIEGP